MKIQEFREILKKCKKEDVEKIASELYKMLSKNQKETDADPLIAAVAAGETPASSSAKKTVTDFETLKKQINEFIENVDNGYYSMPNRIVPKAKRSKWRFEVKSFIKMINKIPADSENGQESAKLLRALYQKLAYGCGYYILPSEDPFQSVGIRQPDFYNMLVRRTFAGGFTDENVKNMLEDAVLVCIDRNSLYREMEIIYAEALSTSDLKYKAIGFIKEYVEKFEKELKQGKAAGRYSTDRYYIRCCIEKMCQTMLLISILLCESDAAVEFCWEHIKEKDEKVLLYVLLDLIRNYGEPKLWVKVYEDGLNRNIEPPKKIQEQYKEMKQYC